MKEQNVWIFNLWKYSTMANNVKMLGLSKLLHNIGEAMLRVMDHLFRLKIMMRKWIVLSKKETGMNLSYRHHFGFAVVGKLKLAALNPKVSIFVSQYSISFFGLLWGIFCFFLSQFCLGQYWFCVRVGFFPLQKKFHWEVFILAASTSWNTSRTQTFERHLDKLSQYRQDEISLLACFGLFHNC